MSEAFRIRRSLSNMTLLMPAMLLLLLSPRPLTSAVDHKSSPGTACREWDHITGGLQGDPLRLGDGMLRNDTSDSTRRLIVDCPMVRDHHNGTSLLLRGRVGVYDNHPGQQVSCTMGIGHHTASPSEFDPWIISDTRHSGVDGTFVGYEVLLFQDMLLDGADYDEAYFFMTCEIPPIFPPQEGDPSALAYYLWTEEY